MINTVLQPQEVEVFYIIPALRSAIAKQLKEQGKSQKEIAHLLGLRESTVSQYINERRANLITFSREIEKLIHKSALSIKEHFDVIREVQSLLYAIKNSRELCIIHQQINKTIPKKCDTCFIEQIVEVKA